MKSRQKEKKTTWKHPSSTRKRRRRRRRKKKKMSFFSLFHFVFAAKRKTRPMTIRLKFQRVKYFLVFVVFLLVLNGRPKFVFRSHWHLPWLTNVENVQPLKCFDDDEQNWPMASTEKLQEENRLTVVIVSVRPEFKRLPLTLAALASHLDSRRIFTVIFLVPPADVRILKKFFSENQAQFWPWPISLISDAKLLKHVHTDSYRLQMMFKLIVAQIIPTEFYLILDSDCVAIWPIHVQQLLSSNCNDSTFRSIYQIEERIDRENWWSESEELLQIESNTCVSNHPKSPAMAVTPIILSKSIALRTLCRLKKLYGDEHFLNKLANWALWRLLFDRMWTEYTLYYLTARCTQTFDRFHFHLKTDRCRNSSVSNVDFYGLSVWWRTDWNSFTRQELLEAIQHGLEWREKELNENSGRLLTDSSRRTHHLFTVLQGRQYIDPKLYHQLFYPIFRQFLQRHRSTLELVHILDRMVDALIN